MDAAGRSLHFLKRKLDHWHWFSRGSFPHSSTTVGPPNLSLSPAVDLEASRSRDIGQQDPQSPDSAPAAGVIDIRSPESTDSGGQGAVAVPRVNPLYNFDWGGIVVGFCLTSAVEIALQSLQPQIKIPLLVHLLSLAMVFAFSSIFVSFFFPPDLFPRLSLALRLVAMLSVFTAFFLAITVPFSLSFKLISWSIFALSLLFIVYAVLLPVVDRLRHA